MVSAYRKIFRPRWQSDLHNGIRCRSDIKLAYDPRSLIIAAVIIVWALRLGPFLYFRIKMLAAIVAFIPFATRSQLSL